MVDIAILIDSPETLPNIPMMNLVPYTSTVSINGACAFSILTEIIIDHSRLWLVETIALDAEMNCVLQPQIICMRLDLLEEFFITPLIIMVVTITVLLIKLISNPKVWMWIIPPTVPKMNNNFPTLLEGRRPMAEPMVRMRGIPKVHCSWATTGRPYEPGNCNCTGMEVRSVVNSTI